MAASSTSKLIQKKVYDVLSHRYGTIMVICGCLLVIASAFQFGEVALEWSREKYAAVFNSFSDNVGGRSFRDRLCLPVPIDVVYTWVNGSDPKLLRELYKVKAQMEIELNETRAENETCKFSHCVPSHLVVVEPGVPAQMPLVKLAMFYPALKQATKMYHVRSPATDMSNATVLAFMSQEQVDAALKEKILIGGKNASLRQGYYTNDWQVQNSVSLSDTIFVTGFPHEASEQQLLEKIPAKYGKSISKVEFHQDKGVAILTMPDKEDFAKIQDESNITLEGKQISLRAACLLWDLHDYSHGEDVASNRFEDNEEMRYSLRSIEKYAPWIRHVYIVTNGQIPSWLNLDSPRLTLVTHDELFPNKSHLPSFGSPAIESHLHQIPGLSDKFIYLNDDVMFGQEVWPDDFFTHAHGQKIYLTWPVPNCQDGCPSSWIRDGYCDKACNNSDCEWDGGDCAGGAPSFGWGVGGWQQQADVLSYCNAGCSNSWIADRYCDTACSIHECGFDAGDCGTKNYDKMHEVKMDLKMAHYVVPSGEVAFYINTTTLFGANSTVQSGSSNATDMFRSIAIAQKFNVITVVMNRGHNATTLFMELTAKRGNDTMQYNCSIAVDTRAPPDDGKRSSLEDFVARPPNKTAGVNATGSNATKERDEFHFHDVPLELLSPKAIWDQEVDVQVKAPNMSEYQLSEDVAKQYQELNQQLKEGDLTEKGFERAQWDLWENFVSVLKAEGREPEKATHKPSASTADTGAKQPAVHKTIDDNTQKVVDTAAEDAGKASAAARKLGKVPEQLQRVKQQQPQLQPQQPVLAAVGDAAAGAQKEREADGVKLPGSQKQLGPGIHNNNDEEALQQHALGGDNNDAWHGVQKPQPALGGENPRDGVQEQQPAPDSENAGDKMQEQQPGPDGENAGDRMQEQQPAPDGENAGDRIQEQQLAPNGENAGDRMQEQQPAPDGENAGDRMQEQQPAPDGENAGDRMQEQQLALGGDGHAEDEAQQQKAVPMADDGAGEQPAKAHVDIREMEAALGVADHPHGGAPHAMSPEKEAKLDGARNVDDSVNKALGNSQQEEQQQAQQEKEDMVHEAQKRNPGQEAENSHKSRKLQMAVVGNNDLKGDPGFLPWEQKGVFAELQEKREALERQHSYDTPAHLGRRTLDTFGDSLRHVNMLYNKAYGFASRKVPAHMPHMIDRHIMQELQDKLARKLDRILKDQENADVYVKYLGRKLDKKQGMTGSCNKGFFPCDLGPEGAVQCVRDYLVCDGSADCNSGRDEAKDTCEKLLEIVSPGVEFQGEVLYDNCGPSFLGAPIVGDRFNNMTFMAPSIIPWFPSRPQVTWIFTGPIYLTTGVFDGILAASGVLDYATGDIHLLYRPEFTAHWYPKEWEATSSHQVRSSKDMQFAFSYFYYLMSEPQNVSIGEIFNEMDMDHSGTFSDREIRTLATRLFELPLDLQTLTGLESIFINCSRKMPLDPSNEAGTTEKYYDPHMPQVTKQLVVSCPPLIELLKRQFPAKTKYKHELVSDEQVAFKMIRTNVSGVVGQLDDVRKNPKKFICLNDNIEHGKDQAKTVKAVLQDFYESLFPIPSSFELPRDYRNRFLHVDELYEWKKYRDWLRWWTIIALFLLIIFTLSSFFSERIEALQRKYFRRRRVSCDEHSPGGAASHKKSPLVTV